MGQSRADGSVQVRTVAYLIAHTRNAKLQSDVLHGRLDVLDECNVGVLSTVEAVLSARHFEIHAVVRV